MQRDRWIQVIASGVLALSLAGSVVTGTAVSASAGRHKLAFTERAEENDPPDVSLGIAMGAFRGLFVNWLWMRANALKEQGRYYEAIDLARAITRLQPRFSHVWVFHAWNMAYNISVATNTLDERWRWVQAGIRLLRDEAIPANPNDLLLHKELAYIFNHKVQGWMDDANGYYKRQFAKEWTIVLGQPPRPDPLARDREKTIRRWVDWFRPIAESPDSPAEVFRREPAARRVMEGLKAALGADAAQLPAMKVLEMHAFFTAVARSGMRAAYEANFSQTDRTLMKLVEDPELAPGWAALLAALRRRILIDEYHMEPERMLGYMERFGPIDWRHPSAHALYWSTRGGQMAVTRVGEKNSRDYDFVNTDRMVVQSLQELWRSGEIYFDFLGSMTNPDQTKPFYTTMPNLAFTDSYGETLGEFRARSQYDEAKDAYSFYSAGYENFLIDATRFYYRRGQYDKAQEYYDRAAKFPQFNLNDMDRDLRFSKPLDEFVFDESKEEYTRPDVARLEAGAALEGAYLAGILAGDPEVFRGQFEFAKRVHAYFMSRQRRVTAMDPDLSRMELMPADFRLLAADVLVRLIGALDPDEAETLYNNAPEDLRRYAFDRVKEVFSGAYAELARRGGRTFAQAFPEPPGMDEHRALMRQLLEAEARRRPKAEEK